jgi:ABC-type sugar transport system ATPase subunit
MADTIVVMKNGELQQTGTPEEIYAQPANRFVAGFVGSPTMNFFEGGIVNPKTRPSSTDAVFQEKDGVTLPILRTLPEYLEQATLGIRPENIALEPFTSDAAQMSFRARVERVEFLGYERLVYVRTSANAPLKIVRMSISNISIEEGLEAEWFVKPDAYCVFNSSSVRV